MDVNCSGYSGPWPGAAAHFFCPVPGSTGNNPNNCTPVPMTGRKKNPAEAGQLEKLFWLIPNAASCDSEESHPESQDCNHTRMNIERWRIMRLDCRQHDYPEKAHPRHKVTKSTHHHVPLLHIRVHPIVGNPHDCRQDTMLDNVLPFYPPKVVSTRQRCCSRVWSAVIASSTLYIYSTQSLHICQQQKELLILFFQMPLFNCLCQCFK